MRLVGDGGFPEAARDGVKAEDPRQIAGIRMILLDPAIEATYLQVDLMQCHRNYPFPMAAVRDYRSVSSGMR